jgi:hypothetical protein
VSIKTEVEKQLHLFTHFAFTAIKSLRTPTVFDDSTKLNSMVEPKALRQTCVKQVRNN